MLAALCSIQRSELAAGLLEQPSRRSPHSPAVLPWRVGHCVALAARAERARQVGNVEMQSRVDVRPTNCDTTAVRVSVARAGGCAVGSRPLVCSSPSAIARLTAPQHITSHLAKSVPEGKGAAVGLQPSRSSGWEPSTSCPASVQPQKSGCVPSGSRAASTAGSDERRTRFSVGLGVARVRAHSH
jgi:hypothetical protein